MIEPVRGCGLRKVGGLYMEGEGLSRSCDRLPYLLEECPVCGEGIKFSRGFQWIHWYHFAGQHTKEKECTCPDNCPLCYPQEDELKQDDWGDSYWDPIKYGLLWVGNKFYTPGQFVKEALEYGISKRIGFVPSQIEVGKTWVLLAHKKGTKKLIPRAETRRILKKKKIKEQTLDGMAQVEAPAIFYAFRPTRIIKIITEKEARDPKVVQKLKARGIVPLVGETNGEGQVTDTYELSDLGISHPEGGEKKDGPDNTSDSHSHPGRGNHEHDSHVGTCPKSERHLWNSRTDLSLAERSKRQI